VTAQALRPSLKRISRKRLVHRRPRLPIVADGELISVAGLVGSPVYDGSGERVGTLDDLVARLGEPHPPVLAAVVRVGRSRTLMPVAAFASVLPDGLHLTGPLEDHPPEREPGLVGLAHDVIDRQIVDVDGADVVRVSDLVLGRMPDGLRLVGADVSTRTLLRRLGPARLRRNVAVERVYDSASIAAVSLRRVGEAGSTLGLASAASRLGTFTPAELEALLGDLPAHERHQLTASMTREVSE
jgi:sporulation protein YlmC with PRC-barrel domain